MFAALAAWNLAEVHHLVGPSRAVVDDFADALGWLGEAEDFSPELKGTWRQVISGNAVLELPVPLFERFALRRTKRPPTEARGMGLVRAALSFAQAQSYEAAARTAVAAWRELAGSGLPHPEVEARVAPVWAAMRTEPRDAEALARNRQLPLAWARALTDGELARRTSLTVLASETWAPGDAGAAKALARAGLNPDVRDGNGHTALVLACLRCRARNVRAVLAAGADPEATDADGRWPLVVAARLERHSVRALLRAGADPNRRDADGRGALHRGLLHLRPRMVPTLLEGGADPHMADHAGLSPLAAAVIERPVMPEGVPALLAAAGTEVRLPSGRTPLGEIVERLHAHRVASWAAEGSIDGVPVSFRITNGAFTYRRRGRRYRIKLATERRLAQGLCPEHVPFVDARRWALALLEAGADLEAVGPEGVPVRQRLLELGVPSLLEAAGLAPQTSTGTQSAPAAQAASLPSPGPLRGGAPLQRIAAWTEADFRRWPVWTGPGWGLGADNAEDGPGQDETSIQPGSGAHRWRGRALGLRGGLLPRPRRGRQSPGPPRAARVLRRRAEGLARRVAGRRRGPPARRGPLPHPGDHRRALRGPSSGGRGGRTAPARVARRPGGLTGPVLRSGRLGSS